MTNNKIVSSTKKPIISLFLSVILVTGTIAISSSFTINAQAQPYYYGIDNNYYEKSKNSNSKNININKIKCINDNININGGNTGNLNVGNKGQVPTANAEEGYYYDGDGNNKKQGKGFDDCVINNNNTNTNVVSIGGGGNVTIPPEPTTATLTVKKQVFGCDNIFGVGSDAFMDCQDLQNNSTSWLDCNNSNITNSIFCQSLPESIFDIEVLDDQSTQIQQFEGSTEGTTIHNLEPGTYTVNEIKNATSIDNQLGEDSVAEGNCISLAGFADGGNLFNSTLFTVYSICFEYEDEQGGNDCNTITLAAGEERTCTVKNYIRIADVLP